MPEDKKRGKSRSKDKSRRKSRSKGKEHRSKGQEHRSKDKEHRSKDKEHRSKDKEHQSKRRPKKNEEQEEKKVPSTKQDATKDVPQSSTMADVPGPDPEAPFAPVTSTDAKEPPYKLDDSEPDLVAAKRLDIRPLVHLDAEHEPLPDYLDDPDRARREVEFNEVIISPITSKREEGSGCAVRDMCDVIKTYRIVVAVFLLVIGLLLLWWAIGAHV